LAEQNLPFDLWLKLEGLATVLLIILFS